MQIRKDDLRRLTVAERIHLVEEIWETIEEESGAIPLSEAQREELDRRIGEYEQDPSATTPWSEVREELEREG